MNAPALPGPLASNPSLDKWVAFPAPGQVTIFTGRVEFGQGVLTAMAQIAADELGVPLASHHGALRRHRADAQRRLHRRQPVDAVRRRRAAAGLRRRARAVPGESGRDAGLRRRARCPSATARSCATAKRAARITGRLPPSVNLAVPATGAGAIKTGLQAVGQSSPRLDLPAKVFGQATFIHDMSHRRHAACPRGAPAQPRRHARLGRRSRHPPRRQRRDQARSHSCAPATSSPSSATTKSRSMQPPRSPPITSVGRTWKRRRRCSRKPPG